MIDAERPAGSISRPTPPRRAEMPTERTVHLPDPDGVRGGGEPWWHEGIKGASVTPVARWNRDDEDVPTLDLVNVPISGWTVSEARRFALAILAAADYAERPDPTGEKS